MKRSPAPSRATPVGVLSCASVAEQGNEQPAPPPATVVMVPDGEIARTSWSGGSARKTVPCEFTTIPDGELICALTALALSPQPAGEGGEQIWPVPPMVQIACPFTG